MLSQAPTIVAREAAPNLLCSVCLDTWKHPVMMVPCEHIYCEGCVATLRNCPDCRAVIETRKAPHRILMQLSESVSVVCEGCQWGGTRSESYQHSCYSLPSEAALASTVRRRSTHDATPELTSQLAAYFVAFGGCPSEEPVSVTIEKPGFCELLRCLHYAESQSDFDKIYTAVRELSASSSSRASEGGDVTVGGLLQFLKKYPADPRRLYQLPVTAYQNCMYQLSQWLISNSGGSPVTNPQELSTLRFTPTDFARFVRRHEYQSVLEGRVSLSEAEWIERFLPLVDVCDVDGQVSRHEAMRFMSSCIRGTSIEAENEEEGLPAVREPTPSLSVAPREGVRAQQHPPRSQNRQSGPGNRRALNRRETPRSSCCLTM